MDNYDNLCDLFYMKEFTHFFSNLIEQIIKIVFIIYKNKIVFFLYVCIVTVF